MIALERAVDLALCALLRALQVALERAARALQSVWSAKLLTQRRVLESNCAAVGRIELPIAEAVSVSHKIGAIELIVADYIDGDRAAPTTAPTPTPIVMTPQCRADEESDTKADDRGTEHVSRRVPIERPVGRPQPGTVDHVRIVDRHVINVGVDRFDHDAFERRPG